jgi:PAS domain S-box-containing protein
MNGLPVALLVGESAVPHLASVPGLHESILEHLPAAIYMTDAEGRITFYNRAAAELAGREPELGRDKWCVSWRLRRPDGTLLPHNECPMAITLKSGRPVRGGQAVAERPDGSLVPFMAYPTPLFSANGELIGAVNMLVNVSERHADTVMRDQPERFDVLQSRLAAIVEFSNDAIISKDLSGTISTWNKGAERIFGYTAEEAIGQPITLLIPEEQSDEEPGILRRIRNGERVEHYETKRRRKDGTIIDVSLTISPVRDHLGNIIGASKIARDVTGRKRAEEALARRVNEQAALHEFTARLHRATSLKEVYQASLDAIMRGLGCDRASLLLFDDKDVMRFVAWRSLSEDYRMAVDGHSPWTKDAADPNPIFVEDVDTSDLPDELKKLIRSEGIVALGFVPLVKNGSLVGKFMTYYDQPHVYSEAEIDICLTIARQLGFSIERLRAEEARRRVEEALRESEQRLQMALTAGRMGAWEWEVGSGRVVWSPGLEELHGLEPGTFGGTFEHFKRDIHPDDLAMVEARMGDALHTSEDFHVIYRIDHPSGTTRWIESFGRFNRPAEGRSPRIAGVCMDITQRKETETQRDLLVAELSHRVKNTLATVISIARQSFATNPDAVEAQRSFNARIRALGQTHSRLAEASWSGVSLETILLDELAPYRHDDQTNLSISGPYTTLTPKQALTLAMAAHELATNAAKYGALSHRGGRVEVEWTKTNGQLRLKWCETGGPKVMAPTRYGFGRMLLERIVAADLGGAVRMDFASGGLCCEIDMPL